MLRLRRLKNKKKRQQKILWFIVDYRTNEETISDRTPTSIARGLGRGRGGSHRRAQSEDVLSDASMDSAVMSESIIVQRQLTTLPGTLDVHMRQQVEVLTASQQLTYDQLKQFWDEHQALRRDTGAALGQAGEAFQK